MGTTARDVAEDAYADHCADHHDEPRDDCGICDVRAATLTCDGCGGTVTMIDGRPVTPRGRWGARSCGCDHDTCDVSDGFDRTAYTYNEDDDSWTENTR